MFKPIKEIVDTPDPEKDIYKTLLELYESGPSDAKILETLTILKIFHREAFNKFEEKVIVSLGLFYKIQQPSSLYSFLLSGFGETTKEKYGAKLTPVQANIRAAIDSNQYISISAPTSSGKSHSIRDYLFDEESDIVIVVPSRALIAEYIASVKDNFKDNKEVMVLPFADYVFTSRKMRRIYIITPERAKDLYKLKDKLNIAAFFFDEAQVSEDQSRGVIFDMMVRRVRKEYPKAKLIFAHPFVENPEAQFSKHEINEDLRFSKSYEYGAVGKAFVFKHKGNKKDYFFSPFSNQGHQIKNSIEFEGGFKKYALSEKKSILVYVSKSALYKEKYLDEFSGYIKQLPDIANEEALAANSECNT